MIMISIIVVNREQNPCLDVCKILQGILNYFKCIGWQIEQCRIGQFTISIDMSFDGLVVLE